MYFYWFLYFYWFHNFIDFHNITIFSLGARQPKVILGGPNSPTTPTEWLWPSTRFPLVSTRMTSPWSGRLSTGQMSRASCSRKSVQMCKWESRLTGTGIPATRSSAWRRSMPLIATHSSRPRSTIRAWWGLPISSRRETVSTIIDWWNWYDLCVTLSRFRCQRHLECRDWRQGPGKGRPSLRSGIIVFAIMWNLFNKICLLTSLIGTRVGRGGVSGLRNLKSIVFFRMIS